MPDDKQAKNLKAIPLILFAVTLMVCGQILEKKGIGVVKDAAGDEFTFATHLWAIVFNKYVLIGIVGYGISAVVWLLVLSTADLSFAYPFLAISYVAIILVSPLALPGEPSPDIWKGLAVLLIVAGVISMSHGERIRERRLRAASGGHPGNETGSAADV
jgi:drug/metabolite transporter (DMT)-like permease